MPMQSDQENESFVLSGSPFVPVGFTSQEAGEWESGPVAGEFEAPFNFEGQQESENMPTDWLAARPSSHEAGEVEPYSSAHEEPVSGHENLVVEEITVSLGRRRALLALHALLSSGYLRDAALAALLEQGGRQTVQIGRSRMPVHSYFRMISRLCNEAAEQSETEQQEVPGPLEFESQLSPVPAHGPELMRYRPVRIDGYSEYAEHLSPEQSKRVTAIAQIVVDSFKTAWPIRAVAVLGHADTALRKPAAERAKFEYDVSLRRAQLASEALNAEFKRLAGGRTPGVQIVPTGKGSSMKWVSDPVSEEQRKCNRRVEFIFVTDREKPPARWTWIDAAERGLVLTNADSDPHRRIRCMLELLLRLQKRVKDGYFNFGNFKNFFFPKGPTQSEKSAIIKSCIIHVIRELGSSAYFSAREVSDAQFLRSLEDLDSRIIWSINKIHMNGKDALGSAASVLVEGAWQIILQGTLDPTSIYSCYAQYLRADPKTRH